MDLEQRLTELEARVSRLESRQGKMKIPTIEEAAEYVKLKNYPLDVELWHGDRERKGWEISKGKPIKSWKADIAQMVRLGHFLKRQSESLFTPGGAGERTAANAARLLAERAKQQ